VSGDVSRQKKGEFTIAKLKKVLLTNFVKHFDFDNNISPHADRVCRRVSLTQAEICHNFQSQLDCPPYGAAAATHPTMP
jgi:hypothetical protein